MKFAEHVKQTLRATATLSLALAGLVAVIVVAASGMEIQFDVEFERSDAIWILLGLPLMALAACLLLSPLSFLFERLLFSRRSRR
jgi:hypothetical protein